MSTIFLADHMKFVVLEGLPDGLCVRTLPCPAEKNDVFHKDIKKAVEAEQGCPLQVRGGGRIHIMHERRVVKAYGRSGDFGPADPAIVRTLLEQAIVAEAMKYQLEVDMDVMETKDPGAA